jgi:hypothetical protein
VILGFEVLILDKSLGNVYISSTFQFWKQMGIFENNPKAKNNSKLAIGTALDFSLLFHLEGC